MRKIKYTAFVMAVFFFALQLSSCGAKKPTDGAASPTELIEKLTELNTQNDSSGLLRYLVPEDRALLVALDLFSLKMFLAMTKTMGSLSSTLAGSMVEMAGSFGADKRPDDTDVENVKTQVRAETEEKLAPIQKLDNDLSALLKKHGLNDVDFNSLMELDSENFQIKSKEIAKQFEGVDLLTLSTEVTNLMNESVPEQKQSFEIGPFDISTLKTEGSRATVKTKDSSDDSDSIVMTKQNTRWYLNLKEIVMGAQKSRGAESTDSKENKNVSPDNQHPAQVSLQNALKGTWKGTGGTLTFNPDGTAIFNISTSREYKGKLVVEQFKLGIEETGGTTNLFSAYLDSVGKLHVKATGDVGILGKDRKGIIKTGMFSHIEIGKQCQLVNTFSETKKTDLKCKFLKKGNDDIFEFETEDEFSPDKMVTHTMIHLTDQGILVPSDLRDAVFEKQK